MSYELTNAEKIEILTNHVRNFEFAKYNLQVDILAEQAVDNPDPIRIADMQSQVADMDDKVQALENEITRISAL